jgi:hypothetical protein
LADLLGSLPMVNSEAEQIRDKSCIVLAVVL